MLSNSVINVNPKTEDLKTIAQGAVISFIGQLSITGLNVVFYWLLARTLGPARVGVISLGLSIAILAGILAAFGLQFGVLRFVALYAGQGDQARVAGAIISGVRVVGITSLIIAVILFGVADLMAVHVFDTPILGPVLRMLALSLPFSTLMGILLSVAQGLKRIEYRVVIEQMVVPLLKIGGLIVVVYTVGHSTIGVAFAIVVASLVGAILAAISVWQLYPLHGQRDRPVPVLRAMLSFSWPLLLMRVVNRTLLQAETLMLGALATSDQVGIYYVALRTTVLFTVFLAAFNTIFAPIMAELHGRHEYERLGSLFKTVTKWGFTLCLPVFLLVFIFSEEVMLVFGLEFVAGAPVLQTLAVSQLINAATGPLGWLLTMTGHSRLNLLNASLSLALSLTLAFLLVPLYGIIGAAAGAGLSTLLINILRLIEVYIILHIHPYGFGFLKPIVAGLAAMITPIGLLFLMPDWQPIGRAILSSCVLALTYVIALAVLRLDEDERVIVDAFRRRLGYLVPRGAVGR